MRARLARGMRLLGMDHGETTLGLALSDPALAVVTPLKTLSHRKFSENIRALAEICREYNVGGFVIGLPLNMDGTTGPRAQAVKTFVSQLLKANDALGFDPPICFFDERLSTFAAEDLLIEDLGMSRRRRKEVIDAQAAAHILSEALKQM
jgi:putative Holliday junction resolvase